MKTICARLHLIPQVQINTFRTVTVCITQACGTFI